MPLRSGVCCGRKQKDCTKYVYMENQAQPGSEMVPVVHLFNRE